MVKILSFFAGMIVLIFSISAHGADRLVIKDGGGATTFKVEDTGSITTKSRFYANGAGAWGAAPMVLGQVPGNHGIVITDMAAANPKNLYIGWDLTQAYVRIMAVQEGMSFKNLTLNPLGGNVGIRMTNPTHPLHLGSGAYCSAGGVWTDASSRDYKENITELTSSEAGDALIQLRPVKFNYKEDNAEQYLGFIAEDVPELVATSDRKGMSAMDVVAVLTKVVQDQQKVIENQNKLLETLIGKVAQLELFAKSQSEMATLKSK